MLKLLKRLNYATRSLLSLGDGAPGAFIASMKDDLDRLAARVQRSPIVDVEDALRHVEIYQPIYGMEGIFAHQEVSRTNTRERAAAIEAHLPDVTNMHMLDIGSSLGYVGLYFADRGAIVEGWDYNDLNVLASLRIKAASRPTASAHFVQKELTLQTAQAIRPGEFNACMVLSVLHHITVDHGEATARAILAELTDRIPYVFVELANRYEYGAVAGEVNERLSSAQWVDKLPESDQAYFRDLQDVDVAVIGEFGTHLSDFKRKLYMLRKHSVEVNGKAYIIRSETTQSYAGVAALSGAYDVVRYIDTDEAFIKIQLPRPSSHSAKHFRQGFREAFINGELERVDWSSTRRPPALLDFEVKDGGVALVYERLDGFSHIYSRRRSAAELVRIARTIVGQVQAMRSIHLQHNDISPWNIMVDEQGDATLIDFGLAGFGFDVQANIEQIKRSLFAGQRGAKGTTEGVSLSAIEQALGAELCSIVDRLAID